MVFEDDVQQQIAELEVELATLQVLSVLIVLLFYWYKITKIDAAGVRRARRSSVNRCLLSLSIVCVCVWICVCVCVCVLGNP